MFFFSAPSAGVNVELKSFITLCSISLVLSPLLKVCCEQHLPCIVQVYLARISIRARVKHLFAVEYRWFI